jgi:hypothetical protein
MKTDPLHQALIRAGRADPTSDAVPYAFEKRVMAAVRRAAAPDPMKGWVLGLWRAALSSAGVAAIACLLATGGPAADEEAVADTLSEPDSVEISGVLMEDLDPDEPW